MAHVSTYVGISIVGGLIWRRANRWGAAISLFVALLLNFLLYHLKNERLDYWDPNIFLVALVGGGLGLVVVSLLTSPEPESIVAPFFAQLQIPSDLPQEQSATRALSACRPETPAQPKPIGAFEASQWAAKHGRQLLFVNLLQLRHGAHGVEFFKAYREDLRGLAVGAGLCGVLVGGLWLFLQT